MKTIRPILISCLRAVAVILFLFAAAPAAQAQSCQAAFMYTADTTSNPNVLTLTDSSWAGGGTITTWAWSYNGAPVGTNAPNQTLNLVINPFDVICLSITTDSGCVSSWCDTITFLPPCNATVGYTYTHDSLNNYIFAPYFTGMVTPVTYYWNSSNGATSTQATFTTQFNTVGFYNVCLWVTDANGCGAMYCDTIPVSSVPGCQGCTPHIVYTIDSLNPHLYTFTDTTTYLNTPTTDTWTVNGVNSGTGSSITVNLPNPGTTYNVCHNVTVAGCPGSCPHNTCVSVFTPQLPGIHINYFDTDSSQVLCTAPQVVNFYVYGNVTGYPLNSIISFHIFYDDGTDSVFATSNTQNYFYINLTHIYLAAGSYTPQVIVYSPDSLYTDTMVLAHALDITNACAPLSGHVYLDNNANCVFDAGDSSVAYRSVYLTNGTNINQHTYTDLSGFYSFNVPTGQTYTITISAYGNWYTNHYTLLCPASGSLTTSTVPSSNNNFFLSCPTSFDLSVSVSGWGFVPGRTGSICVYPHNIGCVAPAAQIQLILDPLLTALPDSGSVYTINGDTVTWNVTSVQNSNGYYQSLCVHVVTATTATIGDTICVTATILPIAGDSIPSNNTASPCWAVRTSWDPNDKAATPEGSGPNHAIRPETELTYTIRFQNTGTASAQDIYILDTIDAKLDLATFEVVATSHVVEPSVIPGRVLRFSYNNINLPDSNVNEPMSHGYITYRITPMANVAHGDIINNTAGIYFDFNPAVVTNTTFHQVDFFLSVHQPEAANRFVTMFPNPANDKLFVELKKTGRAEVKLYDVTGRIVLHTSLLASGTVNVQSLPHGTYNVQVMQNGDIQNAVLIISK